MNRNFPFFLVLTFTSRASLDYSCPLQITSLSYALRITPSSFTYNSLVPRCPISPFSAPLPLNLSKISFWKRKPSLNLRSSLLLNPFPNVLPSVKVSTRLHLKFWNQQFQPIRFSYFFLSHNFFCHFTLLHCSHIMAFNPSGFAEHLFFYSVPS